MYKCWFGLGTIPTLFVQRTTSKTGQVSNMYTGVHKIR